MSEVDCLMEIDDPWIVRLYNNYVFDNHIYMLMEHCVGDLSKFLGKETPPKGIELQSYIRGVITAVKACHDKNIAHCDLKPSNFLIDTYGRIKIGDFGLSTIFRDKPTASCVKGTPMFMAPEIFKPYEYNPMKADIWAMGVTLYVIATGMLPFHGRNIGEIVSKIENCDYNIQLVEDNDLKILIAQCLDLDPECRPTPDQLLIMNYFKKFEQSLGKIGVSKNYLNKTQFVIKPKLNSPNVAVPRNSFCLRRVRTYPRVQKIPNF